MKWRSFHPSNREQIITQQKGSQCLNPTAIIDSDHPQELPFLGSETIRDLPLCARQNQAHDAVGTSREVNREVKGGEGGGYGQAVVRAVSPKSEEN